MQETRRITPEQVREEARAMRVLGYSHPMTVGQRLINAAGNLERLATQMEATDDERRWLRERCAILSSALLSIAHSTTDASTREQATAVLDRVRDLEPTPPPASTAPPAVQEQDPT